ncbi:hypothetical protein [Lysobacter sp. HA18]
MTSPSFTFRTDKTATFQPRDSRLLPTEELAPRREGSSSINNTPVVGPPKPVNALAGEPPRES